MIRITGIVNGTPTDEISELAPVPDVSRPETSLDLAHLASYLRDLAAPSFSFRGLREKSRYKHAALVVRALDGKPLCAPQGERNNTWFQSFAGTVGDMLIRSEEFDKVETEALAQALTHLFAPALEAQLAQDAMPGARAHSHLDSDVVEDMFCRSISDRRATADRQRATKVDAPVEKAGTITDAPVISLFERLKRRG